MEPWNGKTHGIIYTNSEETEGKVWDVIFMYVVKEKL